MSRRWLFFALIAALLSMSVVVLDWRMMIISLNGVFEYLAQFSEPDLSFVFVQRVSLLSVETISMAVVSTLLSAILAALLAMSAGGKLKWLLKLVFNFLRSVPELLFASLLVIAVGLGPSAGILALSLHTTGVLARLYLETLENADRAPANALLLSGASSRQAFWYGDLPIVKTQWIAYTLYRSEMNVRAATILGVVGAGGLGQQLFVSLSLFQYDQAATLIIATIVIVMLAEMVSRLLRSHRFTSAYID